MVASIRNPYRHVIIVLFALHSINNVHCDLMDGYQRYGSAAIEGTANALSLANRKIDEHITPLMINYVIPGGVATGKVAYRGISKSAQLAVKVGEMVGPRVVNAISKSIEMYNDHVDPKVQSVVKNVVIPGGIKAYEIAEPRVVSAAKTANQHVVQPMWRVASKHVLAPAYDKVGKPLLGMAAQGILKWADPEWKQQPKLHARNLSTIAEEKAEGEE